MWKLAVIDSAPASPVLRGPTRRGLALVTLGALAACSGAPATRTVGGTGGTAPGAAGLAKDELRAARLVYERSGTAWDVHCDGKVLSKRRWEGGSLTPIGACGLADPVNTMVIAGQLAEDVIALDGARVARWNPELTGITLFEDGRETRVIPVQPGLSVSALALDRGAVVAVVRRIDVPKGETVGGTSIGNALAALVRIDGDKVSVKELVAWRGTGAGVDPSFVATGPEHLVLANRTGNVVACDYALACGPVKTYPEAEASGGIATQDGGLVLYRHDHSVTRIDARGAVVWSKQRAVYGVFGATDREVWIAELVDLRRPLGLRALALADGTQLGFRATLRTERRDAHGRFLQMHAVAATPRGAVARGIFGGTLRHGEHAIETERVRATCYWETWHEGQEIPVPFDATCDERFAKAIETKRAPFVAFDVETLKQ
ncbi:MAG: hypothetical protein JNL83_02255 [Myxococcales bacterium]|nr:hypothetical protein [Myxococcales bacterium]